MKTVWLLVLMFFLGMSVCDVQAKNCKKGQPCGNSCISWKKICRIGTSKINYSSPAVDKMTSSSSSNHSYRISQSGLATDVYEVAVNKLNVRGDSNANSLVLGEVFRGTRLRILETDGSWGKIYFKQKIGWVHLSYLKRM